MQSTMNILTWNINGIRAVQRDKSGLKRLLDSLNADVICLQETKVTRDMLDEPTAIVDGYDSFFCFCRKKTGYSGTANFCRLSCIPSKAEEGLTNRLTSLSSSSVGHYCDTSCFIPDDLEALDNEGRCIITQHKIKFPDGNIKEVAIINVYVPRAGDQEERLEYKLKFLTLLQLRAETLLRSGIHVIVLGDINTTHTNKDHCDPQSNEEYIRRSSRIWLNQFLQASERDPSIPKTDGRYAELPESNAEGGHFSDIFRKLHPDQEQAFTNWCTLTGARQTNYGRRLDYILVDTKLAQYAKECNILADVHGSDHCPVVLKLDCTPVPSSSSPALCSKFMPEFRGLQKKLSSFFSKVNTSIPIGNSIDFDSEIVTNDQSPPKYTQMKSFSPKSNSMSSPSSEQSLKRQTSSKNHTQSKKAKLQKEDSKQSSLKFFYHATSKPKCSQSETTQQISVIPKIMDNQKSATLDKCETLLEEKTQFRESNDLLPEENLKVTTGTSSKNEQLTSSASKMSTRKAWKNILGGLPPPPLCTGHEEPTVLRTVKKEGPNKNKQFYVCNRPDGAPGNPLARCDFFQWLSMKK